MIHYYVNQNPQTNGDHEVHIQSCKYLPTIANRTYLGYFGNCKDAVDRAKQIYRQSNGCYFCSNACHTS